MPTITINKFTTSKGYSGFSENSKINLDIIDQMCATVRLYDSVGRNLQEDFDLIMNDDTFPMDRQNFSFYYDDDNIHRKSCNDGENPVVDNNCYCDACHIYAGFIDDSGYICVKSVILKNYNTWVKHH